MAGNGRFTREDEPELKRRGSSASAGVGDPVLSEDDELRALELDDLDREDEPQFLRGQKRVAVRRGPLPKKTANRLKYLALAALAGGVLFTVGFSLYRYGAHSWRFRVESGANIELSGNQNVSRAQVMEVMGADIGRNVFFVPLDERKKQLEQIPWVEAATVMRLLPDRLRVQVKERTPVAFVQLGSKIVLIDAGGVLMELPAGSAKAAASKYSFPVIVGTADSEPLSTRAARMKLYNALVRELDWNGSNYSKDLSEIELSDPDDVKITVADPAGAVVLHLGSGNFMDRYKTYIAHAAEWRVQYQRLESVDLRFDRQVIVNPDPRALAPAHSTERQANPAGVKPATAKTATAKPATAKTATAKTATADPATAKPASAKTASKPTRAKPRPRTRSRSTTHGKRAVEPTHRD
ncbi:MAG: FtsQ-type POTRA domain-containing protein [Acidobacteriota bacterium]|nr:FtsQ-type POTRA domain-containing protein [Acidobacteriota bacterium]